LINKLSIKSPIVNDALKKAVYVLVADPSTYSILPKKYEHKYIKMLETGIVPRREFQKEYNHQRLNLLWVGNIIPRKGLPLILHALANLKDSYDIKLTVVGDGSDKLRCQELAKKLGIQMKVDFVGKLNYLDVQKIYNQADVFIFTSLRDTSGNVVLEAMNNKLPVIALNHHGVSEMVTPDCGIKIEVQSVEQIVKDLSEAIKLFYHNRELLSQMGNKGYERIKQVYDWGKKAEEMSKIYQKAMSIGQK
jgi:glycosyltransferase involved in cell wall biosynthesis